MSYRIVHQYPAVEKALQNSGDRFWKKKPPRLHKRANALLSRLKDNPTEAGGSHLLHHNYKGLRGARINDNWRLIYKLCDECSRNNWQQLNPLPCCVSTVDGAKIINILNIENYH